MNIPDHLLNEHYDDRYFDVVNAVDEAKHVFFDGSRIIERLGSRAGSGQEFVICETGFGAGRILVALLQLLDSSGLTNITVRYRSVELHPLPADRIGSILAHFRPQVGPLIDLLLTVYNQTSLVRDGWSLFPKITRPFGTLQVELWYGEALDMVKALDNPCDAWFLDGHGPKKNPAMWRQELLAAVGEKTVPGGTFATYTVAGFVRRGLAAAGFSVEQFPGFGGKKSVLRGEKNPAELDITRS